MQGVQWASSYLNNSVVLNAITGCKENHFYSLPFRQAEGKIYYSPNIISTSPKKVLMSRLISKFFGNLNSSKNFTCPIAKSTNPGLSDTTFFARCIITRALSMKYSICNIHLLPKAADLRKEAFDEFPLIMAIVLQLLSRIMLWLHFLADFQFIPRSQGLSTEWHARNSFALGPV